MCACRYSSVLFILGKAAYEELFPGIQVADLYQEPELRPRRGHNHLPTITTGCSRLFAYPKNRFIHGYELLLIHGVSVAKCVSDAMGCARVDVRGMTHWVLSKLAGNSMHASCIGLMLLAAMCCTAR